MGQCKGWTVRGRLQPWLIRRGAIHMVLYNTGMGPDWMGICVHASNYPPRKLYALLTLLKIICHIIVYSLSSAKRNDMSVSCRF
jgi:hypothetical protein